MENIVKLSLITGISALVVFAVFYFSFGSSEQLGVCVSDSDCVPAQCCHASSCVFKDDAPDCSDVFCSMECVEGTMDCGAGSCACVDGVCLVDWA